MAYLFLPHHFDLVVLLCTFGFYINFERLNCVPFVFPFKFRSDFSVTESINHTISLCVVVYLPFEYIYIYIY